MSRKSTRSGLTLLELMIVLLVIGGMLALTWPNLRKSLERNELNEAARTVRELLEEVRYQAMVGGQIGIVRLEQGIPELRFGSLAQWSSDPQFQEQLTGTASSPPTSVTVTGDANRSLSQQTALPKSLRLPEPVVFSRLDWGADPARDSRPASFGSRNRSDSRQSDDSNSNAVRHNSDATDPIPMDAQSAEVTDGSDFQNLSERKVWWLVFLADGSGQDVTIRLVDTDLEEGLSLLYRSGMGTVEVQR
jgi:prepilin-type N-terminal cleavage/methylation domain-containing protein